MKEFEKTIAIEKEFDTAFFGCTVVSEDLNYKVINPNTPTIKTITVDRKTNKIIKIEYR